MKALGSIVRWDDARGFGFIRSAGSTSDVFFHVRDIRTGSAFAPREGLEVAFDVIHVGGKGPRAVAVHLPGAGRRAASSRRASRRSAPVQLSASLLLLALGYFSVLAWAAWTHRLPWWVVPASGLVNVVTLFAYWQDKFSAQRGSWRTPESTLHIWSLAGGWPLAHVAQQVLRHKSSKREFLVVYWVTVVVHVAAMLALLWHRALPH